MDGDGKLVVISGPSGVGKSTVCAELVKLHGFAQVVTCTTRSPRPDEVPGRHYNFMSRKELEDGIAQGRFLEHAIVHGNLYGTPRDAVETQLRKGKNVILSIDVKGAAQLRDLPDMARRMVSVFLLPPSESVLRERLSGRRTEDAEKVAIRLETARKELLEKDKYDHVVVNEDLGRTVGEVFDRVQAHSKITRKPTTQSS